MENAKRDELMSAYAIHLRSETPALLVEFNLPPGTHARIGAASAAEITIPLAGLADIAGLIGRDPRGRIYVANPDGTNLHFIELPAALPLPPYHFVIFHPSGDSSRTSAPSESPHSAIPQRRAFRRMAPAAILAVVMIGLATLIVIDQSENRGPKPEPPQTDPITESVQTTPPVVPAPEGKHVPSLQTEPPKVAEATPAPPEAKPEPAPQPQEKLDLEALAQRVAPAVFLLEVKDDSGEPISTGTAFAVSADGLAVTNFHVVEKGSEFVAKTSQGAEFSVSAVTATDPDADLALVSLKANGIPFLELGESESLNIGAPVAVFGCPKGLSGTLSEGILSARRNEAELAGEVMPNGGKLMQITAPISPGSSGSPVIDRNGKVIGVATAGFSGGGSQNLNFIVPVEAVQKLRRDSIAGLAKGFQGSKRDIAPDPPKSSETEVTPESAFFRDPEFPALKRLLSGADWIAMQKIARKLAAKYPESPSAHLYLGFSLFGLDLHESAEVSAKRGLALAADHPGLWFLLGSTQLAQGRHEEARESLKKSAAISPDFSSVWQKLAASFLIAGEYLDAVSPLDKLRKLDRAEFERLLSICRSMRVHSQEMQAMLSHFDAMAEAEATSESSSREIRPVTPQNLAATLISRFLRHGEGPDIRTELSDYAPTVDPYFDQGRLTRSAILKDLSTYRAQWPRRTLQLVRVESARMLTAETLEASFRLRYTATDGRRNRAGTLVQSIRYTRLNGVWLVSGIRTTQRLKE